MNASDLGLIRPNEDAETGSKHRAFALASRLRAAGISALGTAAIACGVAALIFSLWYPSPFREISGGNDLFLLIVGADLVLGPLVTFCVFDRRKPQKELLRDLAVVVTVQLAGLSYGLHALYVARPAALALEKNRVRVVRAADLDDESLAKAPVGLRRIPRVGQLIVAAEDDPADTLVSVQLAMAGLDIGQRPERWLPPERTAALWRAGSRPAAELLLRYSNRRTELEAAIAKTGLEAEHVRFLPLIARRTDWVVLIDANDGRIVGYAPFDGF